MKNKFITVLSLVLAVCMLGGCTEKAEHLTVSVADLGDMSAEETSSTVSSTQAGSFSAPESNTSGSVQSTSSSSSSKPQVSVVIPQSSSQTPQVIPTETDWPSYDPQPAPEYSSSSTTVSSSSTESSAPVSSSSSSSVESSSESIPVSSSSEESSSSSSSEPEPDPVVPSGSIGTNSYHALNYSEVKGVWISYIELAGLPSSSESTFRSSIASVFDNCVWLGINTVFVHVRSHSDAYYESDYYPRTKYLDGTYDPLPIMIDEAHKRGLSFQAWINPLRGCSVSDIGREKGYPIYNWAGGETRLVEVNGYYYLNPAYSEVIDLIAEGAAEIAAKYDVDGVHIDDYFYPTTEKWFDNEAYQESPYYSLSEFRFANCDRLVSSLYSAVKSANSTAIFGVSPQGNYQNNYDFMYADVKKWCTQSGYLDYIMPQIYFGFKNEAQPFSEVVRQWDNIASNGKVPLIVGLAPYRLGTEDGWGGTDGRYEWVNDKEILKRQFIESTEAMSYGGICLYSYNSLFNPSSGIKDQVDRELSALKSAMN